MDDARLRRRLRQLLRSSHAIVAGACALGAWIACTSSSPDAAPVDAGADGGDASLGDATTDAPSDSTSDAPDAPDGKKGAPTTIADFHVPGTQIGDVTKAAFPTSDECGRCHAGAALADGPNETWKGSLMGIAGRDPLFFAQLTNANQDAPGVGYYCLRCHVPASIVSGHASDPRGGTLDAFDRDGVTCSVCHAMVDPTPPTGSTPPTIDGPLLASLADAPSHYGNAMFVLDPSESRRGPYDLDAPAHLFQVSPFHRRGDLCGTCHDVGNVETSRKADGSYAYNDVDRPATETDPQRQFPLERTYTEWKLSAFAKGGVDMKGRFGGGGASIVSSCQDCHMPRVNAKGATTADARPDLARHEFAGASAWVLRIAAKRWGSEVDGAALEKGARSAEAMLAKAGTLELTQSASTLKVKAFNESGHKLPTGHIEGRRAWVDVRILDAAGAELVAYGKWDPVTAELDEATTTVFEMKVGLSDAAAALTGYPAGTTTHMSLADVIVKDTRIPPRGFVAAAYAAVGAGALGYPYADGQYWADLTYVIPKGGAKAKATFYYQTVTRHYIEALRDGNVSDALGSTLYDLWKSTAQDPPIPMATVELALASF